MSKKSREERRNNKLNMIILERKEKEESLQENRKSLKELMIENLKSQLIGTVRMQYQVDPEQVKRANMERNADYLLANPFVKIKFTAVGATKEDAVKMLSEIRDTVLKENAIETNVIVVDEEKKYEVTLGKGNELKQVKEVQYIYKEYQE